MFSSNAMERRPRIVPHLDLPSPSDSPSIPSSSIIGLSPSMLRFFDPISSSSGDPSPTSCASSILSPVSSPPSQTTYDFSRPMNKMSSSDDEWSVLDASDSSVNNPEAPIAPPVQSSYPYPIKLWLKLSAYPEMKPFSQLVEKIRHEHQSNQRPANELIYCKHVQRLTSQHLEQNQTLVNLYIFVNGAREPARLTNVSLQWTVAEILHKLHQIVPFDYDQSLLKLRSRDEYLRHDDVLCNIEHVHTCLTSLKQLQFLLVKRPTPRSQRNLFHADMCFLEFALDQQGKLFHTDSSSKLLPFAEISSQKENLASPDHIPSFAFSNSQSLDEFRTRINLLLSRIEHHFNRLADPYSPITSLDERMSSVQDLCRLMQEIQKACSHIRSSALLNKQHDLKEVAHQLSRTSLDEHGLSAEANEQFLRILYELLAILVSYLRAYCDGYPMPCDVLISNEENASIDLEQWTHSPMVPIAIPRLITESRELLTVHIDRLFRVPSAVSAVRVVVNLCYGHVIRAREMTKPMSTVRHSSQNEVRFYQQLSFNDVHLCQLEREALLLFEVYGSIVDETDSSASEVFDGLPMRSIGWCSQALFDQNYCLATGERHLGVFSTTTSNRTGFYPLKNAFGRDHPIITMSFSNQAHVWPELKPTSDISMKDLNDIDQDTRARLCRLLDRPSLLLADHSTVVNRESSPIEPRPPISSDEESEFSDEECQLLWSHRHHIIHKPYSLPKLLKSRSTWDYPSLINIYALVGTAFRNRPMEAFEALELLLPAFPDMSIRSIAYRALLSTLSSHDLTLYLPQLLETIKFDYRPTTLLVEYLLQQCLADQRVAHQLYWNLRQLLVTEQVHFLRYYHLFISLLYVVGDDFRLELQNEYELCLHLKRLGRDIKADKSNRAELLREQLTQLNVKLFHSPTQTCRLPCQFSFVAKSIDIESCSIFSSFTSPMKLAFNPVDSHGDKYYSIYKIGEDLRQDQTVLQLFSCMDRIWQLNNLDCRLSLFNVVQTQHQCGFIEMITESQTLLDIESRVGSIRGSFGESTLYDWLRSHNANEHDFRLAVENLTYSCAAYCVATYILGIGDRHNENIMVKKSGHLFHIDFGKYFGDTQKFGWFNRDRTAFVFTKQMLYAISEGGTADDAMSRFVDLCCSAYNTLRENSTCLLVLLAHLCSSNVPNLNFQAVRFVYDRLALSSNYATSITYFTDLILTSLKSVAANVNGLIHRLAQTTSLSGPSSASPQASTWRYVPNSYVTTGDDRVKSAQVVSHEKPSLLSKDSLYKLTVVHVQPTYLYRTYSEFYDLYERLNVQYPLIDLHLKHSVQTEDAVVAQQRVSDINDFLDDLFRLNSDIVGSNLVCLFFRTNPRDQQINEATKGVASRAASIDSSPKSQAKVTIELTYEDGELFVLPRHATNLPITNGSEPKPYCKSYLFPDELKLTKRKGKIADSRNPIFNDKFTYKMDLPDIQKRVLRVSVWNNVLPAGNYALGDVDIALSQIDLSTNSVSRHTFTILPSSTKG